MENNEAIRKTTSFDELLDLKYGEIGTPHREAFEERARYFIKSELKKEASRQARMADKGVNKER